MLAIAAIAMIAWHMKALEWAGSGAHLWATLPLNIATCFAVTLCWAAISWHLVEQAALQLKSGAHVR